MISTWQPALQSQTALERFNAGIERLTAAGKDGRPGGVLDPSGPWRKDIQAAGRPAGAVGGGAATLRRPAGKVQRAAQKVAGGDM